MPEPLKLNEAVPVLLVSVMSVVANPVTDLEKLIPTSNVSATCVPVGSVKLTVATVVSKLMAFEVVLAAGPVRVPSVTPSFATASVIVPVAFVGEVTVAV